MMNFTVADVRALRQSDATALNVELCIAINVTGRYITMIEQQMDGVLLVTSELRRYYIIGAPLGLWRRSKTRI